VIKMVVLLKRKAGVSLADFGERYEHRHAPLFERVIPDEVAAAIKGYTQSHPVQLGRNPAEPAYDCVTEFLFDDLAGLRVWSDWYLGDAGKVLRDDEEEFMDTSQRVVLVTDERHPTGF
jgi:hypothetical protein